MYGQYPIQASLQNVMNVDNTPGDMENGAFDL